MKLWRRGGSGEPQADTAERRMAIIHAQRRVEAVEKRADAAIGVILRRHDRNHWTETIARTVHNREA